MKIIWDQHFNQRVEHLMVLLENSMVLMEHSTVLMENSMVLTESWKFDCVFGKFDVLMGIPMVLMENKTSIVLLDNSMVMLDKSMVLMENQVFPDSELNQNERFSNISMFRTESEWSVFPYFQDQHWIKMIDFPSRWFLTKLLIFKCPDLITISMHPKL